MVDTSSRANKNRRVTYERVDVCACFMEVIAKNIKLETIVNMNGKSHDRTDCVAYAYLLKVVSC